MRINLRTFGMLTMLLTAVGFVLGLSAIFEFRILGLTLLGLGIYLFHLLGEEKKRLRKRQNFYQRVGRLIAARLDA